MGASTISIVDADPDLAEQLDDEQLERARHEALTRVQKLSPGEWDVAGALEPDVHHRGFLIVAGLLSREVNVLGRHCIELIGPCDVMRPWSWDDAGSHVRAEVGWEVLEPTKLAVLDHALVTRINPWPQLGVELFNRGTRRAHHLAVALAIAHHNRVEDRLLLTLWHLAERWGKVTPDGHRRARCRSRTPGWPSIVGAHRPSVTTAMGALTQGGPRQPPRRRQLAPARRAAGEAPPPQARRGADLEGERLQGRVVDRVVEALAEVVRVRRDGELGTWVPAGSSSRSPLASTIRDCFQQV